MRFKVAGNKKDIIGVVIKNAETTITISAGAPVFLAASGTSDGLGVISAVSVAAADQCKFYGLALTDISPGAYGESIIFGFYDSARVIAATRAASSDNWASYIAASVGAFMLPGTGTGSAAAAPDQAMSFSATAAFSLPKRIELMTTWASSTTQSSTKAGSGLNGGSFPGVSSDNTALFTTARVFVHAM